MQTAIGDTVIASIQCLQAMYVHDFSRIWGGAIASGTAEWSLVFSCQLNFD